MYIADYDDDDVVDEEDIMAIIKKKAEIKNARKKYLTDWKLFNKKVEKFAKENNLTEDDVWDKI